MELFDSHCHLDVPAFDHDREQVLESCRKKHIGHLLLPGIQYATWLNLIDLCEQHAVCHAAVGLHPVFIEQHRPEHLDRLDSWLDRGPVVAVGEIGLDFYRKDLDPEIQLFYFSEQLKIARDRDLPVVIHARKSHDQVLQQLRKHPIRNGIIHAFNGSPQQAERYIELGFLLGFGGTLTYSNAPRIHRLAKSLPLQSMALETDAPDMVVAQHRGERNSPAYLTHCLAALAVLRNQPAEEIAAATTKNVRSLFKI